MFKLVSFLIFTSLFLTACLDEAPRNRPTFSPFQSAVDGDGDDDPDKTVEAPTRPDGEVYLQSGHCGCKAGEPITLGNCASFCDGKSSLEETLYVDVKVGEAIETSDLRDFYGWCTSPLTYEDPETGELVEDGIQANCEIQVKDENGSLGSLGFTPKAGSSKLEVNIADLDYDKTYRISVVEVTSGASSDTIQVRKVSDRVTDPVGGPIGLEPVNQYTCITREFSSDDNNGDNFFESASRNHYYFIDEDRPEPLPRVFANIYCHDYQIYGTTPINNPLLEETSPKEGKGSFWVWNKWDPRFFDLDGPEENGDTIGIHRILQQKIKDLGFSSPQPPEIFFPLEYYNGPPIAEEGKPAPAKKTMGYYMQPFVDGDTFRAYCPNADYYNSDNPLFRAMKDVVGVDTEGLYMAKQDGVCDVILIGETLLKKIWFYIENGVHLQPNDQTVSGKQLQFYWPADPASPYIKKSHQRVYTLKRPGEPICGDEVGGGGVDPSQYPTHDKRIGCVPAP